MSSVTYLGKKHDGPGYVIGTCGSMREAMKESSYKKGVEVHYFNADVEKLIRNIGFVKVHSLATLLESYVGEK